MKKKIVALCLCVALAVIAIGGATLAYFTDTTDAVENTFTMGNVKISLTEPSWKANEDHVLMPGKSFDKDPTITVTGTQDSYVFLEMSLNKYSSLLWVMAADASADKDINFTIFDANGALLPEYKNDKGVFSTTKFLENVQKNKDAFQTIVNKWFKDIDHTDWEVLSLKFGDANEVDSKMLTIRLAYIGGENKGILKQNGKVTFMTGFEMPASVTQKMIDDGKTVGMMQNTFNTEKTALKLNFTAYAVQATSDFTSAADAWAKTFGATTTATTGE